MSERNVFDKFTALMDQNIRGVQWGVYAVAGIGFCIAMRSVRPVKKFSQPSDIPKHFIDKRMRFSGKIIKIQEGKTPILDVVHYPLLSLPFRQENTGLPVQISSVDVTPNGSIWLNTILQGKEISFVPLKRQNNAVESIVYDGKKDVGQHLVSIGFATVSGLDLALDKDPTYSKYYKSLISNQRKAENKGNGVWKDQELGLLKKISRKLSFLRLFS